MSIAWQTPETLVNIGFSRSRIVMMNEAHNGLLRCIRTRLVGIEILASAHQQGVRYFAMEALYEPHLLANKTRKIVADDGLFSQAEMRNFVQIALDLGWILFAYDADTRLYLEEQKMNPDYQASTPEEWEHIVCTNEFWQWRERLAAANLAQVFRTLAIDAKMLVWVGWQHHARQPGVSFNGKSKEYAMGYYFEQMTGQNYFSIDQTAGIYEDPANKDLQTYCSGEEANLQLFGGTAGFLREDSPLDPNLYGHDTYILSTKNYME